MSLIKSAWKYHKKLILIIAAGVLALSFLCAIYFTNKIQPQDEARQATATDAVKIDISHDRGYISNEAVIFDSGMGEIRIEPAMATATSIAAVYEKISMQTTSNPETIWINNAAVEKFTPAKSLEKEDGSIAVLEIPTIKLTANVYESGNNMEDMAKGIAHFPSTSAFEGNVGLSSHNINLDSSNGYFLNLYKLKEGDVITYTTDIGARNYAVSTISAISDDDWSMLGFTDDNRITLITCISGQPDKRLCVQAKEIIE